MKHKHLSIAQRDIIELHLNHCVSISAIALQLNKDCSTISKEIKRHRDTVLPSKYAGKFQKCSLRSQCSRKNVCWRMCNKQCKQCPTCMDVCSDYVLHICTTLSRAPHVCNGCDKRMYCREIKYYYHASSAHNQYSSSLSQSRVGIHLSHLQLAALDKLVSPLLYQGQSIEQIFINHATEIPCSKKTLYNYIDDGLLIARNIDLQRKVLRFAKRTKRILAPNRNPAIREHRTYEHFQQYVRDHPHLSIMEMDTVEGTKGGKLFLTLFHRKSKLLLALLLPNKASDSVLSAINQIETLIGYTSFHQLFSILLTDNGCEFSNPDGIERNCKQMVRSSVFYCDPRASQQKGAIERSHEYLRIYLPKGSSFDAIKQNQLNILLSHINSAPRASLNNQTPIQVFRKLMNDTILKALCIEEIEPDKVILHKRLLLDKD